ncbi:hypothetical protein FRB99_005285 [Tulasnella sp. 403]|nr:hypothetical protein FRB99_005285 [Tulasnella sp. 403]
MSYRHRNALYLRISAHVVLPLYLYLDDKHVSWMSDRILQRVIADMKPLILKKWREEQVYKDITSGPKAKRFGVVDVYRGGNAVVPTITKQDVAGSKKAQRGKRKRQVSTEEPEIDLQGDPGASQNIPNKSGLRRSNRTSARNMEPGTYVEEIDQPETEFTDGERLDPPTNVTPAKVKTEPVDVQLDVLDRGEDDDVEMNLVSDPNTAEPIQPSANDQVVMEDVEEEQIKPVLQLRYSSVTVPNACLCVIIEPWDSGSDAVTRESSVVASGPVGSQYLGFTAERQESEAPVDRNQGTPLFRAMTPMAETEGEAASTRGSISQTLDRVLPPVPLFHEAPGADDDATSRLLQFSQAMNVSINGIRSTEGEAGDEDEVDALYADADERR